MTAETCSEGHWQELLEAMNKSSEEVTVSVDALDDVLQCHRRAGAFISRDLLRKEGRSRVVVNRLRLFELVNEHGRVCGVEKPSAEFLPVGS